MPAGVFSSMDAPTEGMTRAVYASPLCSQRIAALSEGSHDIELWVVDLLSYPWQGCQAWMSPDENDRARRFRFGNDERRYRAVRCAVREILGRRLGRDPASLAFQTGPFGKPSIVNGECGTTHAPWHFNLSHSGDAALIGLAPDMEIGVDIEQIRTVDGLWQLAEQNFTPVERQELATESVDRYSYRFLCGWTRKEACLKAVGCGLSIAPNSFQTGLSDANATAVLDTDQGPVTVHVQSVAVGTDAVAAVAWIQRRNELDHPAI